MDGIPTCRQRGFTLLELLAVIALLAILQGIALPAFSHLVESIRVFNTTQELRISLRNAQAQAAKTRHTVRICPSADGSTCDGADWHQGWITYRDSQNDADIPIAERILFRENAKKGITISKNGVGYTVGFFPDMRINVNQSFTICGDSGDLAGLKVVITQAGRVRVDRSPLFC